MILPLRNRHRRTIGTLAVILPVAFVFGVTARRDIPQVKPLATHGMIEPSGSGKVVWTDANAFPSKQIVTSLRTTRLGPLAVEFVFRELAGPDVLVYWASGNTVQELRLPENAQLLGPFLNHETLPLPPNQDGHPGRLVLYSVANQEVVAVSGVINLPLK